ncbi:DUF488 domain-containing protein [Hanamia caeni]|jgi:uncharacterized protein (DUF488 family)|uniref:DUF488 domain-containing protein n=1 Tax=Hanamia caeni TaxID=2294116 RepID=A0A3M9N960_9BACT|nr:DUF488 domain-containing protein [Hanamia caeni]RNI33857.1 DUF488 domain-containing protein [Hanamia caeni]
MKQKIIYTIGHSTHTLEEFIAMLKSFNIELLADIRSFPGSRKFPHFNKENLPASLAENNIEYIHLKNLGGRRKVNPESCNTGWRVAAFRGYADYMETENFEKAIKELEQIASEKRVAYMCAEAVWWRCHRSLVSDYLKHNGWTVLHIMGVNKSTEHPYTAPAKIMNGKLNYSKE